MRTHYHVTENVPGYLPETEPFTVQTKAEALTVLRQWKTDLYDSEWDLPRSQRRRVYGNAERDLALRAERPDGRDLGLVIEAVECHEDHGPEEGEHEHSYGPVEYARLTGNPHRKCDCGAVSLDLADDAPGIARTAVIEVTERPRRTLTYGVELTGATDSRHDGVVAGFRARGDANAFALELRRRIEQYEPITVRGVV